MATIYEERAKKKVKRQRPEFYIQSDIIKYFKENYPEYLIYSCPNEACYKRKGYFEAMGLLPGVADLTIITDKRPLFIECKSPDGRQSKEQRIFQANVERLGYKYYIVRSLQQFKDIIQTEFNQ